MVEVFMRRRDVEKVTGLPRSTIYLMMAEGRFPKPIRISSKSVAWLESDIANWQEQRIRESEVA